MKIISLVILITAISSCHFYTALTYRVTKNNEYIKEEGYMIKCERDFFKMGEVLIVNTYTPKSWGEDFYYKYLNGIQSDKQLIITDVKLQFMETKDTLSLNEVRKEHTYIFTSPEISKIINCNKHLKVTIFILDTETKQYATKEYILLRHKHTYPTSTLPHTL